MVLGRRPPRRSSGVLHLVQAVKTPQGAQGQVPPGVCILGFPHCTWGSLHLLTWSTSHDCPCPWTHTRCECSTSPQRGLMCVPPLKPFCSHSRQPAHRRHPWNSQGNTGRYEYLLLLICPYRSCKALVSVITPGFL